MHSDILPEMPDMSSSPAYSANTEDKRPQTHYNDVIMGAIASQFTSLTIVYSTINSNTDQRKHQSFASLAFVRGIHGGPVNSPHKWPVTRKRFPFDDIIMHLRQIWLFLRAGVAHNSHKCHVYSTYHPRRSHTALMPFCLIWEINPLCAETYHVMKIMHFV